MSCSLFTCLGVKRFWFSDSCFSTLLLDKQRNWTPKVQKYMIYKKHCFDTLLFMRWWLTSLSMNLLSDPVLSSFVYRIRGGKHIENCIDPQNTLVGPIWRCCGQKTRPPGHFWVPFRPNLVFALFTWENGPKLAKNEQISKSAQYSPKNGKCMQQMSNPPFWGVFRRVSGVGS